MPRQSSQVHNFPSPVLSPFNGDAELGRRQAQARRTNLGCWIFQVDGAYIESRSRSVMLPARLGLASPSCDHDAVTTSFLTREPTQNGISNVAKCFLPFFPPTPQQRVRRTKKAALTNWQLTNCPLPTCNCPLAVWRGRLDPQATERLFRRPGQRPAGLRAHACLLATS